MSATPAVNIGAAIITPKLMFAKPKNAAVFSYLGLGWIGSTANPINKNTNPKIRKIITKRLVNSTDHQDTPTTVST
jgi:hypothetical protein